MLFHADLLTVDNVDATGQIIRVCRVELHAVEGIYHIGRLYLLGSTDFCDGGGAAINSLQFLEIFPDVSSPISFLCFFGDKKVDICIVIGVECGR